MKKPLFAVAVLLGLSVTGVSSLYADPSALVKVPFPFIVGDTRLPAGEYRVVADPQYLVVAVVGENRRAISVTPMEPEGLLSTNNNPTFVFKKLGNDYFLWKVSLPGEDVREVPLSTQMMTRELAKLAAARSQQPQKASTGQ